MSQKSRILPYVLAYSLWLLSTAIAALVLNLVRETTLVAMVTSVANSDLTKSEMFDASLRVRAAETWSILLMGLLLLIILVFLEHFYRESVPKGLLWSRFFWITGLEMAILFNAAWIKLLLQRDLVPITLPSIVVVVLVLLATILFFALSAAVQKPSET
jgi:hypothetical protein